ncbi:DUF6438 domain-containing protein [Rhodopirellula baltica]|uniref:DUF6438 domain-containing protein n=1 Tax=Rhodopirellula baltica TaxID=265606 RepID=UPI00055A091F
MLKLSLSIASIFLVSPLIAQDTSEFGIEPPDGTPKHYAFLFAPGLPPGDHASVWSALPYSKIELERTGCFGRCPAYTVRFSSGGNASYIGMKHATRLGAHDSKIDIWNYARICMAIEKFDLLNGPTKYSAPWTDDSTSILRITLRSSGKTVEIRDYGRYGPVELWTTIGSIDAISETLDWSRVPKDGG